METTTQPRHRRYDFVCVGGGLGGLVAAVRAHDLGLSVLVIESSDVVGGVAAYSGGDVFMPLTHLASAAGIEDSRSEVMRYLDFVGGEGVPHDTALRSLYVDTSSRLVRWLTDEAGIPIKLSNVADALYPDAPGSSGWGRHVELTVATDHLDQWRDKLRESAYHATEVDLPATDSPDRAGTGQQRIINRGRGLVGGFLRAAVDRGIEIVVNTRAVGLLTNAGSVSGVTVETATDETIDIQAERGVLLATGGYGWASYAAELECLPEYGEQAPPVTFGDALELIEATSATVTRAGFGYVTVGFRSSQDLHPGTDVPLDHPVFVALGEPHTMVVNAAGERFGDESIYVSFSRQLGAYDSVTRRFSNLPAYLVVDDQFRANGAELGLGLKGRWPEAELERADTVDELAIKLGLDPAALRSSVERFNCHCANGTDSDFDRGRRHSAHRTTSSPGPNPALGALDTPPFWGVRLSLLGAGMCSHGLAIDTNANVLSRRGTPVDGLYATGNAVAFTELPGGYVSGIANGRNMIYAFIAATSAAAN